MDTDVNCPECWEDFEKLSTIEKLLHYIRLERSQFYDNLGTCSCEWKLENESDYESDIHVGTYISGLSWNSKLEFDTGKWNEVGDSDSTSCWDSETDSTGYYDYEYRDYDYYDCENNGYYVGSETDPDFESLLGSRG